MRFSHLLILCALILNTAIHASITWQTDYEHALSLSQKEDKPLFLFFNGSDWAGYAMKMKHEILNAPAFQEKIGSRFVCMEVDFPKHNPLPEKIMMQNQTLKDRFTVPQLPYIVLLDANQRIIMQIGYLPDSGEQLADNLLKIVEQDTRLNLALKHLDADPATLRDLYQLAQGLGAQAAIDQILDAGLKTADPYFSLEKYRMLVEKGEMKSEEAVSLRQKLFAQSNARDPVSGQGIPFTLALIDFQELSQKSLDPETAIQPLVEYIAHFGQQDQKNIWRVEMMIAEVFLDADLWAEALKHAERAYESAPEGVQTEIAHSVDYIRSTAQSVAR